MRRPEGYGVTRPNARVQTNGDPPPAFCLPRTRRLALGRPHDTRHVLLGTWKSLNPKPEKARGLALPAKIANLLRASYPLASFNC